MFVLLVIIIGSFGSMIFFICINNKKLKRENEKMHIKISQPKFGTENNPESSIKPENTSQNDMVMLASINPENSSISNNDQYPN